MHARNAPNRKYTNNRTFRRRGSSSRRRHPSTTTTTTTTTARERMREHSIYNHGIIRLQSPPHGYARNRSFLHVIACTHAFRDNYTPSSPSRENLYTERSPHRNILIHTYTLKYRTNARSEASIRIHNRTKPTYTHAHKQTHTHRLRPTDRVVTSHTSTDCV